MTTLVLGPSIGTSADSCWGAAAALLRDEFDVVAWELPGHGTDRGPVPDDLTIEDLAARVLAQVDGPFLYAGDSVGGQVGLQLLLDAPDRVLGAVLCCTGAKIGDDTVWRDRVAQVRASGTASLVSASAQRWFAPGFLEREPERALGAAARAAGRLRRRVRRGLRRARGVRRPRPARRDRRPGGRGGRRRTTRSARPTCCARSRTASSTAGSSSSTTSHTRRPPRRPRRSR